MYGPDYRGQYDYVKAMIDVRGLNNLVTLHQAVFGAEKEIVLLDSDIFIQTSRTEGMPMGILEAFSYGLPCLITKGTTLGDFVKNYNAGWVAETNAQSVFECLVSAIEGKENFGEKSLGALALINENFAWDKIADNAVKAYQKFSGTGEE
jgi:glycosyltransferase involved in cell wall biosynthesis